MFNTSLVDAEFDTTATASAARAEMQAEGVPFSAAEYITRWQRLDDEATGMWRMVPIRVVATVDYIGRHRAIEA